MVLKLEELYYGYLGTSLPYHLYTLLLLLRYVGETWNSDNDVKELINIHSV